jgi:hypothetical protein
MAFKTNAIRHYYLRFLVNLRAFNHWRKKQISNVNFMILAAAIVGILGGSAGSFLNCSLITLRTTCNVWIGD